MKFYCCPFAGAGASVYRSWTPPRDAVIEICPVQLAGREEQFGLPPHEDVAAAARHVLGQIRRTAVAGGEIGLFGHSSGAAVAFEVARLIAATDEFRLAGLVVSGAPDPVTPVELGLRDLDGEEFVKAVERLIGYTHPALAQPELRDILLPPLRADLLAREAYLAPADSSLPVPVLAIRGADDTLVSRADLAGWARVTTRSFDVAELPGDHMYFLPDATALLDLLAGWFDVPVREGAR
ncbi:thioesterase II family protein [Amycolatopsis sp. NPDC004378]